MEIAHAMVVGESKAGTSSIYKYLSGHPEVSVSQVKQVDYFLNRDYRWSSQKRKKYFEDDGGESYLGYFNNASRETKCYLDVSPDYMYCDSACDNIFEYATNKKCKIIFVLRNPIDRFVSWFNFGKQIQLVPEKMSFEEFIDMQGSESNSMAFNALETGRFTTYLAKFEQIFPKESIVIMRYQDLKDDPQKFMRQLSNALEVHDDYFDEFDFRVHNKTETTRFEMLQKIYIANQRLVYKIIGNNKFVSKLLIGPMRVVSKSYRSLNMKSTNELELSNEVITKLERYYESELNYLGEHENG